MVCGEKMRLVEEYTASTWVLYSAVTKLQEETDKGIGENFCSALTGVKSSTGQMRQGSSCTAGTQEPF